jgi:hypothetical protein
MAKAEVAKEVNSNGSAEAAGEEDALKGDAMTNSASSKARPR